MCTKLWITTGDRIPSLSIELFENDKNLLEYSEEIYILEETFTCKNLVGFCH